MVHCLGSYTKLYTSNHGIAKHCHVMKMLHTAGRSRKVHPMSPKSHYPLANFINFHYPLSTPTTHSPPLSTPITPLLSHPLNPPPSEITSQKSPIPWHCRCCCRSFCWSQKSATFPRKQLSPYRNKESGHRCDQYVNSDTLRVSYRIFGKGGGGGGGGTI